MNVDSVWVVYKVYYGVIKNFVKMRAKCDMNQGREDEPGAENFTSYGVKFKFVKKCLEVNNTGTVQFKVD